MSRADTLRRVAEISVRAAQGAGWAAWSGARTIAKTVADRLSNDETTDREPSAQTPPADGSASSPSARTAEARPAPASRAPATPPATPPAAAATPEKEPEHVDREAVVVAAVADRGAEDGPGAELRIDEPYDGYGDLTAREVIAKLADADAATLAVVRLYEAMHRNRSTVLEAVDRRLASVET